MAFIYICTRQRSKGGEVELRSNCPKKGLEFVKFEVLLEVCQELTIC